MAVNIGELCNQRVVTALASDPLSRVARQMCDEHVGMVVVVGESADKRFPVGIVTDRDIVRAQLERSTALFCLSVEQAMSADPLVLLESAPIDEAIEHLRKRGVRRAPVIEPGGGLVGVVSMDDLLTTVSRELSGLSRLAAGQRPREH
jgi:signal-transduction protein with cAMP-binding, CBS, and nucleotidyltransferase domain